MRKLIPFVLFFFALQASAQGPGYRFQSKVQAGLLEGEQGSAFQLQTIHGFQKKTWFAGIGTGLDYYNIRSLPVFLNLRKDLFNREKTPFVYASGGYHFLWLREEDKRYNITDSKGGLYFDAGVGYQLPVKKSALYFTAGYSQKNFSQKGHDEVWITIWPAPMPQTRTYEYELRRLSVQMGLRF
jgi:hypothetical protein